MHERGAQINLGSKIATVDFHTAWCIEFGSTLSVVIA